ncbi:MAG: hypothetical protein OXI44_08210 [Bacteroidota bacterium]|nr:hypothetical protein [Bacteroidota bacterium]
MKTLLRDYLAKLGESGELDVLVADLLLNMQIEPISKPQPGVRQYGVDIAAIGEDPEDGKQKLFLITIKAGDITRKAWNGDTNAVHQSLDEIREVYLKNQVDPSHEDLPKKIVLCCGGILKQTVDANWKGYTHIHSSPEQLEYALWTGDKLALLVEEHFLDEYLFPQENQSLMRKALALLDQNEQEPIFFYKLLEQILFESGLPKNSSNIKSLKALRLANLCLGVVIKWALDVDNTRPALLCAEHSLPRAWEFLKQHELLAHKSALQVYSRLYEQYLAIALVYAKRIRPLCLVKDGLANTSSLADEIEYPLRVFEVAGFLSTLGINHAFLSKATELSGHEETTFVVADTLIELIENNPAATTPRYDSHAIEIALGLLLLFMTKYTDVALAWMRDLYLRVIWAYESGEYFPVDPDSYEDLLSMKFDQKTPKEQLMSLSTLLPTIAEWFGIIGEHNEYEAFRKIVNFRCGKVNLQLWYPDSETESVLYKENAGHETGRMCTSIVLPEEIDALRDTMRSRLAEQTSFVQISCIKHNFPVLGLIASRHFRTPVIPAYWQNLISNVNRASNSQDHSEKAAGEDDPPTPPDMAGQHPFGSAM